MFEQITPHVYYRLHEPYSDRSTIGLVVGEKYTLMFESGSSPKNVAVLKNELAEQGLKAPDLVAVSHWHWDHSFGMCAWTVPTIAGKMTNDQLRVLSKLPWDDASIRERVEKKEEINFCYEMMKREFDYDTTKVKVVPADIEFEGEMTIDLGGVTCRLIHVAGPHSEDSIVCYIPEDKFVFLGDSNGKDLYKEEWTFDIEQEDLLVETLMKIPFVESRLADYRKRLEVLDFDKCIGGHYIPLTREELFDLLQNK